MIAAAVRARVVGHDVRGDMSAHVLKRRDAEPRVTFRCPWCDVVVASAVHGHLDQRADVWLLVGCARWTCGRGVLIRVPDAAPWAALETGDDGVLLGGGCVLPRS